MVTCMLDGILRHHDSNGGGLITDGDTPVDDRGSRIVTVAA
jgi:hypothetical protein